MWRFYVAATAIVAAFVFLVTQHRPGPPNLRISARASGTPSAARPEGGDGERGGSAVRGDAPWALSALPDCARQDSEARGPWRDVRAKVPAGARPFEGELTAGPCTLRVGANGILVTRGGDRLRVPPPAILFVSRTGAGKRYYLYRRLGELAELREYTLRLP